MNKEQYKKLYVLSPNYYEKLKKQQKKLNEVLTHPLDQTLLNILQTNQPNYYNKWLMYKNALIKYKELNDKNIINVPQPLKEEKIKIEKPKEEKNLTFSTPNLKELLKNRQSYYWDSEFYNDQTPFTVKPTRKSVTFIPQAKKSESGLFTTYRKQSDTYNDSISTDDSSLLNLSKGNIFDSTRNQQEDIFEDNSENDSRSDSNPQEIINLDTSEAVEQQLFELAQKSFNEPNPQNIVRLDATLNGPHRAFENRKTRDLVAIEVEPIKNYVEKNVPIELTTEEGPRTDVSPVVEAVDEWTSKEYQPKLIRLASNPLDQPNTSKSTIRLEQQSTPLSSNLHGRELRARRRSLKRKLDDMQSNQPKQSKKSHKGDKKIHQPQQGMGFVIKWERLKQKKI